LALHTRFGFGYQSETPDVSHADAFLESVHRQYNQTTADLDNPSITGEERVELRLRHLSQAHALFQLNPTNDALRDTAAHIYKQRAKSREFTHVYITTGEQRFPLRWCIAFGAKIAHDCWFNGTHRIDSPGHIFNVFWPQRWWPSEASFALIERRGNVYYIKSECMVPYREILSLEVFSFPKL
jgi:hypothetical protein